MEIRLYLQILRRGWWIIVLTTLVAVMVALLASYLATPQYTAVARFIITPGNDLVDRYQVLDTLNTLDRASVTSTYIEVMNSERIYNDTLAYLQLLPKDVEDYKYEPAMLSNSSVLELTVTGPDPQMAAKLANTIGEQTINFTRRLNQVFSVEFLDIAQPPVLPSSPQPLLNAGLAVLLGLISGLGLAISSEQLRIPLEALRQRHNFDEATGVYNSKYFSRILDDEVLKHPGTVFTIGIVELYGLRDLIETLPIASLRKILNLTTETLRKELRGNDSIGRWTDNSFIIMLPNTPGMAAKKIFERISQALSHSIDLDQLGMTVNLDAHIGGAEHSSDISNSELIEKANGALEQSRRANDQSVYVWEIKNPFWTQLMVDEK